MYSLNVYLLIFIDLVNNDGIGWDSDDGLGGDVDNGDVD